MFVYFEYTNHGVFNICTMIKTSLRIHKYDTQYSTCRICSFQTFKGKFPIQGVSKNRNAEFSRFIDIVKNFSYETEEIF